MKILKIMTAYPQYIQYFYKKNPLLAKKSYNEQKKAFINDSFSWFGSWEKYFKLKNYECIEYLVNAEILQKTWAKAKGFKYNNKTWLLSIAEAQIIKEKPDILFLDNYEIFTYNWISNIKKSCRTIKLILGWCGAPFKEASVFKGYDVIFSNIPELVEKFRKMGHKSEHINHAFDPKILTQIQKNKELERDFTFVGQIVRHNLFHLEREKILKRIIKDIDIHIFTPNYKINILDYLKLLIKDSLYLFKINYQKIGLPDHLIQKIPLVNKIWRLNERPLLPVNFILKPYLNPPVFGIEMFQIFINSKVVFNSHIDISLESASNMRLFEATGVGSCLITDWKKNLDELFEPDIEVVTYKSAEECIEKVYWLLEHPKARQNIATAGQKKCLKKHTFKQRVNKIDEIIKKML